MMRIRFSRRLGAGVLGLLVVGVLLALPLVGSVSASPLTYIGGSTFPVSESYTAGATHTGSVGDAYDNDLSTHETYTKYPSATYAVTYAWPSLASGDWVLLYKVNSPTSCSSGHCVLDWDIGAGLTNKTQQYVGAGGGASCSYSIVIAGTTYYGYCFHLSGSYAFQARFTNYLDMPQIDMAEVFVCGWNGSAALCGDATATPTGTATATATLTPTATRTPTAVPTIGTVVFSIPLCDGVPCPYATQLPYLTQIPPLTQIPYPTPLATWTPLPTNTPLPTIPAVGAPISASGGDTDDSWHLEGVGGIKFIYWDFGCPINLNNDKLGTWQLCITYTEVYAIDFLGEDFPLWIFEGVIVAVVIGFVARK